MSLGRHVTLKRFDATSAESDQFEIIGEVVELSGIDKTADTVEDTPYGGTESDYRTFDYGLKDVAELTVAVTYKSGNAQAQELADAFENSTTEKVQLVFPADIGIKTTLDVLVVGVSVPLGKGDKIRRSFTLKPSGEPLEEAI